MALKKLYEKSLNLYNEKKLTPQLCELRNMVSVSYLLIKQSLEKYKGKRKLAAEELGISERTLYRKIKEYNLNN